MAVEARFECQGGKIMRERQENNQLEHDSPFGMGIYFGNRYSDEEMVKAAEMAKRLCEKY